MTVRVFVACTNAERLPMKVLTFSLRETASLAVEVCAIGDFERSRGLPRPRELRNQPRTPFSFQRFMIPELCEYRGRAIYMDADMLVFEDIAGLWQAPMHQHDLSTVREVSSGRKSQFSVMLLDCDRLTWRIEEVVRGLDDGRYTYEQLMHEMCVARSIGRTLDPAWNSLEHYEPGITRLLHYTDMDTQPWVSLRNPLSGLWTDCLRRAMRFGFITEEELAGEVAAGHVRPSLVQECRVPDTPRAELRRLDRGFVPPYKAIRSGRSRAWTSLTGALAFYAGRSVQRLRGLAGR